MYEKILTNDFVFEKYIFEVFIEYNRKLDTYGQFSNLKVCINLINWNVNQNL